MRIVAPDVGGILEGVAALEAGGVVAYPTETVYGLGVDPFSETALEKLFALKERDAHAPVLLIVSSDEHLDELVDEISDTAEVLMDRFWPGPLSLLFRPRGGLPKALLSSDGRICVRWTSHRVARSLCAGLGRAIVSTSANRSGEAPAMDVTSLALPGIDLAIDGGELAAAAPSTVYDPESGRVLRAGAIGEDEIRATPGL